MVLGGHSLSPEFKKIFKYHLIRTRKNTLLWAQERPRWPPEGFFSDLNIVTEKEHRNCLSSKFAGKPAVYSFLTSSTFELLHSRLGKICLFRSGLKTTRSAFLFSFLKFFNYFLHFPIFSHLPSMLYLHLSCICKKTGCIITVNSCWSKHIPAEYAMFLTDLSFNPRWEISVLYGKTQAKMMSHAFRYRGIAADLCSKAPAYSTGMF